MKRAITFLLAFAVVTLVYWLGGFDFDKRGFLMVHWFVASIGAGVFAATHPGLKK